MLYYNKCVKNFFLLRAFFLIFICFFLSSCSLKESLLESFKDFKEKTIEALKVNLSQVPLLRRWIALPPAPKELYKKTEEKISLLRVSKAKDLFSDEYKKVMEEWSKGESMYKKKYYKSAEKHLKKALYEAENLLSKVDAYEKNLKEKALTKYAFLENQMKNKVFKTEEEKIKAGLYLLKLKNLIELGKYDEFEKETEKPPF